MRIGVISDTHSDLQAKVWEVFQGVDHILHAGDIGELDIISDLETIAPVTAVQGNMDVGEVAARYPKKAVIELGGKKIGLTHGGGSSSDILKRVIPLFTGENPDIIIYGHTHEAKDFYIKDTYFFNPGAAGRNPFNKVNTVGIIDITGEEIAGQFISF